MKILSEAVRNGRGKEILRVLPGGELNAILYVYEKCEEFQRLQIRQEGLDLWEMNCFTEGGHGREGQESCRKGEESRREMELQKTAYAAGFRQNE